MVLHRTKIKLHKPDNLGFNWNRNFLEFTLVTGVDEIHGLPFFSRTIDLNADPFLYKTL